MFQRGAEQTAAPSGGDRGPTSEKQRKDYGSEAKTAEYRLEAGQPTASSAALGHAPLFAQVGILATLGFIAAGLVCAIGLLLLGNGHWLRLLGQGAAPGWLDAGC
jgi:hypothetical protein